MPPNEIPDRRYTVTWSGGRGEVKFLRRADGSRLRHFTTGTGPALVLLHTVRTQLDYFQRVIRQLVVRAITVAGAGHFSALERPTEMVRAIRHATGS